MDYLTYRPQFVRIPDCVSDPAQGPYREVFWHYSSLTSTLQTPLTTHPPVTYRSSLMTLQSPVRLHDTWDIQITAALRTQSENPHVCKHCSPNTIWVGEPRELRLLFKSLCHVYAFHHHIASTNALQMHNFNENRNREGGRVLLGDKKLTWITKIIGKTRLDKKLLENQK